MSVRLAIAILGFCSTMALLGVPAPPLAQDAGGESEAAEPAPEFKTAKAADDFAKTVGAFKAGKFKEAASGFKKVKSAAKSAEDKAQVDKWQLAAEGGIGLEGLKTRVAANQLRDAFFQADDLLVKYAGTPIEKAYRDFRAEQGSKVLYTFEDFEHPKPDYTEKFGKIHVAADAGDPGKVYHGAGCIEWAQNKEKTAFQLHVKKNVPEKWMKYDGVVFWALFLKPAAMEVIAISSFKDKKKMDGHRVTVRPKATGDWERVYLPLNKFEKENKGNLDAVESFMIQIQSPDFRLRIDRISLVRKDPGQK